MELEVFKLDLAPDPTWLASRANWDMELEGFQLDLAPHPTLF
jgi:hypothetical protein